MDQFEALYNRPIDPISQISQTVFLMILLVLAAWLAVKAKQERNDQ